MYNHIAVGKLANVKAVTWLINMHTATICIIFNDLAESIIIVLYNILSDRIIFTNI